MNDRERLLNSPAGKQWEKIGFRSHHGIVIPLFSLHSNESCGIGEYLDLLPMIKWCREIGLDLIQLLPLNDTGNDPSPYSGISAFALNPIHLSLAHLPFIDQSPNLLAMLPTLQALSNTQRVDYTKVSIQKRQFLQEYFRVFSHRLNSTQEYADFLNQNGWLLDYGLFSVLKIEHNWQSWQSWCEGLKNLNEEKRQELLKKYESEIEYKIFLQYLCQQQMKQVREYAESQGVLIKGDIPILISRESTDVWKDRKFFQTEYSAGAPPDMYSDEGQNWGFPIYNWENLAKDNYAWWKLRLQVASQFYHIYRLDHIVGFFRIWAIPVGKTGKEGHFIPQDPHSWIDHGARILRFMLEDCPLLPIGEDLGTVPPEVRKYLNSIGVCGTKVIRWERNWDGDKRFIKYEDYPVASMTTVATHDSETLKLWWENNPKEARDFAEFKQWDYTFELSKAHLQEILRDSHHTNSLFHVNPLQEYLALVPGMTWPNPDDERINLPGVISDRNWTYRFRPSIEEMMTSPSLKQVMHDILEKG